jgi:hypothetical protein
MKKKLTQPQARAARLRNTGHILVSPYPRDDYTRRYWLTGEICRCQHKLAEHHDAKFYGRGTCRVTDCKCKAFDWESFTRVPK